MEKNIKFKDNQHIKKINPFLSWEVLDAQKPIKLGGLWNKQIVIPFNTKIYSYITIKKHQMEYLCVGTPNFMRQMDWILTPNRGIWHLVLATEVQVIKKPKRMLLFLEKDERATNI